MAKEKHLGFVRAKDPEPTPPPIEIEEIQPPSPLDGGPLGPVPSPSERGPGTPEAQTPVWP